MKKSKQSARNRALAGMLRPAHITPVAIEDPHVETAADFKREFNAQEAAKKAAKAAAERAARSATILTQASPEMDECPQFVRGSCTLETYMSRARAAFEQFQAGLQDAVLNSGATSKLSQFTAVNPKADWGRSESWQRAYELLREYSYDSVDVTDLSEPEVQPEPVQPVQKFDDMDTSTREGLQKVQEAVLNDAQLSAKQVFENWKASIARDFHGYCPTQSEVKYITDFLTARNLPYQKEASWHSARISAIRAGMFHPAIRYAHEILAEKIESTTELSPMEERRAINAELYRLQQQ